MKRVFLLILVFLSVIAIRSVPANAQACGMERWPVKIGTDADASSVNLGTSMEATIASLIALPAPHPLPQNNRIAPTETTIFVVTATLIKYKLETNDSDYHLVIQDADGHTMITEIPSPDCVNPTNSPFKTQIAEARSKFDARFNVTDRFQTTSIPVQITGVGFFDFKHGQTGVAPNAIELHPILNIVFNPGTPAATETPIPAGQGWEYRLSTAQTAEALASQINTLGADGWELVSVVIDAQRTDKYVAYLKRHK